MNPSGSVAFPGNAAVSSDAPVPQRPPYLPFRRISLPTAPTLLHRESVVSVASFGSLAEEDGDAVSSSTRAVPMPITPSKGKNREMRPLSSDMSTSMSPPRRTRLLSGEQSHPSSPLSQRFGSPSQRPLTSMSSYQSSPGKKRERLRSSGAKTRSSSVSPQDEAREGKRRKVVREFLETERAYVEGLDLIYEHFLLPLLSSLDTAQPILDRSELTTIFSNFIDIWNFHKSFLTELELAVGSSLSDTLPPPSSYTLSSKVPHPTSIPPLSFILLSHFPYLSLYTLFITSFPSAIDTLALLTTQPSSLPFSSFSPSAHNPAFTNFLTTKESHPKCGKLKLRDWLLTIVQRCPRYLLLLKDLQTCTDPTTEEFEGLGKVLDLVGKITISINTSLRTHSTTLSLLALQRNTSNLPFQLVVPGRNLVKRGRLTIQESESGSRPREREVLLFNDVLMWLGKEGEWWERPMLLRGRSKSEAELPVLKSFAGGGGAASAPTTPKKGGHNRRSYHPPSTPTSSTTATGAGDEEKWVYKGHVGLVDLEVVLVGVREHDDDEEEEDGEFEDPRVELLSPEGSWVLYGTTTELLSWTKSLRSAKYTLLSSLGTSDLHSTLTSSAATKHVRRSLQALPFKPGDARVAATIRIKPGSGSKFLATPERKGKEEERRSKVDHFVPAIWIPDEKTPACMRCGKGFGWRRRRHHCRLCGRCVCASCSGRTFYITDRSTKDGTKAARACDACYEAVFPIVQPASPTISLGKPIAAAMGADTITSFSQISSSYSVPSSGAVEPQALMAIDSSRESSFDEGGHGKMRRKSFQRPRSYLQIVEDFGERERLADETLVEESVTEEGELEDDDVDLDMSPTPRAAGRPQRRVEDTVRRSKRFSLPAVSIQPTSVTARTLERDDGARGGGGMRMLQKRFSLVLSRSSVVSGGEDREVADGTAKSVAVGRLQELLGRGR